ncbi:putative secreted glycosidprotein [Lasiodiplodia theobromae]|uniref:Putative secreted glycosidprotein n=1 Tax=Lasiodiplodia theobromae TaxID=45133 RepID=A0A5N5D134_9PEZI|nr:putative secreted glycosidprotein [Lasiodiplodia theobromae]
MMQKSLGKTLASAAAGIVCWAGAEARLTDFVDPLIGTVGPTPGSTIAGGNSFPGAALPWGMVKAGIDTSYLGLPEGLGNDCNAGYSPIGNVTAVSLTHVSGTGGVPTYGLISQMPLLGSLEGINLGDNTTYWQNRSLDLESATVGHFSTTLLNGIKIDITSSNHSALIRYTFPSASSSSTNTSTPALSSDASSSNTAHVLIDLTHVLPAWDWDAQSYSQKYHSGSLHVRGDADQQPSYFGTASYTGGWSQPAIHTLHFCGNFSAPASTASAGTFSFPYNPAIPPSDAPAVRPYADVYTVAGSGMGIGGLFSWSWEDDAVSGGSNETEGLVLEARVGISYTSAEKACGYVEEELPASVGFEEVVERARGEWEERVLGSVVVDEEGEVGGGNETLKRMLYSALYQTGLMPSDKTGENPWWESDTEKPYFDDHYTLWDTYRTTLPLYHLLFTSTYTRILKGLINIFRYEGYLPAGRAANWNGRVQGGTHADTVLADAFVKSVRSLSSNTSSTTGLHELALSPADWADAYAALVKDADVVPAHNTDPVAFDGATKEGRGALEEYLRLGYLTRNHTRSLSRGVEYPQNDFAVWSVAAGLAGGALGNDSTTVDVADGDVARYRDRADWWQGQWNPYANTTLDGVGTFTGFVGARDADGGWNFTEYDPRSCGKCGWGSDIYEAKVWETSFAAAPHDMAKVVELMGGDEEFVKRLDASFLPGFGTSVGANNDAGSALFNPGNEPSFATPFLYNYVPGYNWKAVNQSRSIVDTFYSDARNGYPGNIDSGAIPSWLIFNLIGLFPVAGQPLYLLGTPRFSSLTLRLFDGTPHATSLQIKAVNMSDTSVYPQRVTLNGLALDRAWLSHTEIAKGGELVFEMGAEPAKWDVGERPWSLSPW